MIKMNLKDKHIYIIKLIIVSIICMFTVYNTFRYSNKYIYLFCLESSFIIYYIDKIFRSNKK